MQRRDIAKSVGLSVSELDKLMAKYEQEALDDEECRRKDPRGNRFACDVELEVEHIGGGVTRTICCTRNVSAGGAGLVMGSFLHRGSKARITLSRLDGKRVTLSGIVAFCRHLSGKVHEVGIAFEKPIDPTLYINDEKTLARIQQKEVADACDLQARVLHLVGSVTDAALVAHHLKSTGLEPEAVGSLEDALERLKTGEHAAIVVDTDDLGGTIETLKRLKDEGIAVPRIVLTADESCDLEQLEQLGASGVITKPYAPDGLKSKLVACVRESVLAIYSTVADDQDMIPVLKEFTEELHATGQRLQKAIATGDAQELRVICLWVKGTAAGCGFESIGTKAAEALEHLDDSGDTKACSALLSELASMCLRVAMKQTAA